jgi:hypothetical protein
VHSKIGNITGTDAMLSVAVYSLTYPIISTDRVSLSKQTGNLEVEVLGLLPLRKIMYG